MHGQQNKNFTDVWGGRLTLEFSVGFSGCLNAVSMCLFLQCGRVNAVVADRQVVAWPVTERNKQFPVVGLRFSFLGSWRPFWPVIPCEPVQPAACVTPHTACCGCRAVYTRKAVQHVVRTLAHLVQFNFFIISRRNLRKQCIGCRTCASGSIEMLFKTVFPAMARRFGEWRSRFAGKVPVAVVRH